MAGALELFSAVCSLAIAAASIGMVGYPYILILSPSFSSIFVCSQALYLIFSFKEKNEVDQFCKIGIGIRASINRT